MTEKNVFSAVDFWYLTSLPVGIYLIKVNNRNIRAR